jgi:Domain of unknown function (DUF1918)
MDERTNAQPSPAEAGDWLVVPGPINEHQWRWGRIVEVLPGAREPRYRIRWLGDVHDSVLVAPAGSRVEKEADWPEPAGDAIGVWPG